VPKPCAPDGEGAGEPLSSSLAVSLLFYKNYANAQDRPHPEYGDA
jgi:hypothetical protein